MAAEMINGLFPGELSPSNTIAGCIEIYENAWPNPKETIELLETTCHDYNSGAYWQNATTIGQGAFQNARTNKILGLTHLAKVNSNLILQNIHNQFNLLLLATTVPYSRRFSVDRGLWHEDYSALKYSEGEEYVAHYDGSTDTGRAISALVYLNSDFEGGELEFVYFGIKIKPRPGMLILFPSNYAYRHIAHPVLSGTKYGLVTWIRDRSN
jgi:predicted 2-oxoglutarate/Fe(II)-dependent dioxygenase YbiX